MSISDESVLRHLIPLCGGEGMLVSQYLHGYETLGVLAVDHETVHLPKGRDGG